MSKLMGLLSFAGDVAAARALAEGDAALATVKAVCHADRSLCVDTIKALDGKRTRTAMAAREALAALGFQLETLRNTGAPAPVAEGACTAARLIAATFGAALADHAAPVAAAIAAKGSERKGHEQHVSAFAAAVAAGFMASIDAHIKGLADEAAAKRKPKGEGKGSDAAAGEGKGSDAAAGEGTGAAAAAAATTGTDWEGRYRSQRKRTARAVALARVARADMIAARGAAADMRQQRDIWETRHEQQREHALTMEQQRDALAQEVESLRAALAAALAAAPAAPAEVTSEGVPAAAAASVESAIVAAEVKRTGRKGAARRAA